MSVLIKGMKKPKTCCSIIDGEMKLCPFVNTDDDCVLRLGEKCYGTWEEQYADCPLVELPEKHGRLIDGDALVTEMTNGIRAGNFEDGYEKYQNINNIDDCVECVKYADVIVEAEDEE